MNSPLTVIDLFCGAGGFSEGFRQQGYKVLWAVDNWKLAVDTHKENHKDTETICDNVIRLSLLPDIAFHSIIPDSNVIIGSPPCTFFSNSNKSGGGNKSKGKELIRAYLRIVARKKFKRNSILKYWILENVPQVQTHIKRNYNAKDLGLTGKFILNVKGINAGEYNAKYFGVPSNRIRYFCGEFPTPEKVIKDDDQLIPLNNVLRNLGTPKSKLHVNILDPNYKLEMKGEDVSDHHYFQKLSEFEKVKLIRLKQDKGYMGKMAIPERGDKPSRTIMATMSFSSRECLVFGDGRNGLRAPTIREIASLMSFPIDYRFYGTSLLSKYKLVGNSVPPKLALAFAIAIKKKEGQLMQKEYQPIVHNHKVDFYNLSLNEIPSKIEKPKKTTARFRYHIPYFKFDTYRVELTNYHSNFDNKEFIWDAEIHYNQGKDKAKIYRPDLDLSLLTPREKGSLTKFSQLIKGKIVDYNDFQTIYCMTMSEISERKLLGPYEFLNLLKMFIEKEFHFDEDDIIELKQSPFKIPKPILIGYYATLIFTQLMKGCKSILFKEGPKLGPVPTKDTIRKAI